MFEAELADIYKTIVAAQEKYQHDLTLEEVKALHSANNPTLSRAAKNNIAEIFSDMESLDGISEDVGADLLEAMWRKETYRQLAELSVRGIEGNFLAIDEIRRIVDARADSFIPTTGVTYVTDDLDELLEQTDRDNAWAFNIPSVAQVVPGITGGEFAMMFGRPNSGKSASVISLTSAPGGFAHQGATVLAVCNEEPGVRTRMRHVTAACQKPKEWVNANRREAKAIWNEIRSKVILVDAVGMTMHGLDALVRKHSPDIVTVDQLDKLGVSGSFSASHEKLRAIYTHAREIAKKYNTAVIAVSQASADADGKSIVTPSMAEGSKTGKFAELDLAIGIGQYPVAEGGEEDCTRPWHIGKNKLSGIQTTVYTMLDKDLSTYRS